MSNRKSDQSGWKNGLRVLLALGTPIAAVGLGAPLFLGLVGGELPTLTQWAGFFGVLVAVMIAAGTVIPLIGGAE